MEFGEKLQQLRSEKEMTQEQLAEELFVSRTAISKWENGKGYPNIGSLKDISLFFSISIDDLLSGEELVFLAENENRSNRVKIFSVAFDILDILTLIFLFLPLYGQREGSYIRNVPLSAFQDNLAAVRMAYWVLPLAMASIGGVGLVLQRFENKKWLRIHKVGSMFLQAFTIILFIATQQPYAASLLFLFFLIKTMLLIKEMKEMTIG